MWQKTRHKNQAVNIILDDSSLTFSWIQSSINRQSHELMVYKSIPLPHNAVVQGIMYNTSALRECISDFLHTYKLTDADITLAVNAPTINEQYTKSSTIEPNVQDLGKHYAFMAWDYRYLCPAIDHDGFIMYTCGITREHIFHYQLCALMAHAKLVLLTSTTHAQLSLYHHIYGTAFRQGQLAVDLDKHNFNLATFFSVDILARSLRMPRSLHIKQEQECTLIATSFGLFLTRNLLYGNH